MSPVLEVWNRLSDGEAAQQILPCCGSQAWALGMAKRRPIQDEAALTAVSAEIWNRLSVDDWMEAFSKHPRIGERKAPQSATTRSASWSVQEQKGVASAQDSVLQSLAEANRAYETRFGRVFLVCATGKSASEMLELLRRRLQNDEATELKIASEEQCKITEIRLRKWLSQ
jgi:2-oxo-4-hydroxy-4-carboxy-5-ureidoimidazoline decarboxylase